LDHCLWKGKAAVTIEAIAAFGGVALLGVIGFVYAWFSNRGKTRARHPGA